MRARDLGHLTDMQLSGFQVLSELFDGGAV
jgi:hypothetical protein